MLAQAIEPRRSGNRCGCRCDVSRRLHDLLTGPFNGGDPSYADRKHEYSLHAHNLLLSDHKSLFWSVVLLSLADPFTTRLTALQAGGLERSAVRSFKKRVLRHYVLLETGYNWRQGSLFVTVISQILLELTFLGKIFEVASLSYISRRISVQLYTGILVRKSHRYKNTLLTTRSFSNSFCMSTDASTVPSTVVDPHGQTRGPGRDEPSISMIAIGTCPRSRNAHRIVTK